MNFVTELAPPLWRLLTGSCLALWLMANASAAADFSARDVTDMLHRAEVAKPVSYAGKDLSFLDLAGLDFKGANLAGTNFYGSDLTSARLAGSNLSGARLDRASLSRADLTGANLQGATLLTITAHMTTEPNPADAPIFAGADLSDAYIAARLDGANFRNAKMARVRLGQMIPTWGSFRPRAVLNSADFSGADLKSADLSKAMLRYSQFQKADLTNADLRDCDFTKAILTGADLTGAQIDGADFDGADLTGVRGLDAAKGLALAKNLDRTVR